MSVVDTPRKTRHGLAGLADAAAAADALRAHGIDLDALVGRHLRPDAGPHGVLLTGSLAEGTGTPESDLDLLVLIERERDLVVDRKALNLQVGRSAEVLEYVNGVEVNLEFIARDSLGPLLDAFIELAPALYDPTAVERFTIIERFDLRFLHRLRTGWALAGADVVDIWRDEFMVDLLPTYLALRYYFEYREFREDLLSMQKRAPFSVPHVGRMTVESAVASVLAYHGYTSQSRKWFLHYCRELAESTPVLAEAMRLMFPPLELDDVDAYVDAVVDLEVMVAAVLASDPELAQGLTFLLDEIDYVEGDGADG